MLWQRKLHSRGVFQSFGKCHVLENVHSFEDKLWSTRDGRLATMFVVRSALRRATTFIQLLQRILEKPSSEIIGARRTHLLVVGER